MRHEAEGLYKRCVLSYVGGVIRYQAAGVENEI